LIFFPPADDVAAPVPPVPVEPESPHAARVSAAADITAATFNA
jgi:hypothetical protein